MTDETELTLESETVRNLLARRLAGEITGEPWTDTTGTVRKSELTRKRAIDQIGRMLKYEANGSNTTGSARGLQDNKEIYEHITGQPFDEAVREAMQEMEELDILTIGRWLID